MSDVTIDSLNEQPKKLPVFLKVICILTWVGSGFTVLMALIALAGLSSIEENYMVLENTPGASWGAVSLEDYLFWNNISNISGLLTGAACIFGAVLMWKLKKVGFYLYTAASIISLVVSFMAMKMLMPEEFAFLGVIAAVVGGLFSLAFIIMYAVNLKHME